MARSGLVGSGGSPHLLRERGYHDPIAAATLFDDQICAFRKGNVQIELTNDRLLGWTHWKPGGPDAQHEVALDVNPPRFFEHFFSLFH